MNSVILISIKVLMDSGLEFLISLSMHLCLKPAFLYFQVSEKIILRTNL